MLAESGVAELERVVLGFLYRHSGALRLLATVDDAAQLLLQARRPPRAPSPVETWQLAARRTSVCVMAWLRHGCSRADPCRLDADYT